MVSYEGVLKFGFVPTAAIVIGLVDMMIKHGWNFLSLSFYLRP